MRHDGTCKDVMGSAIILSKAALNRARSMYLQSGN